MSSPTRASPLEGLNEQQLSAVLAPDDQPVLVLAGPGAGKTLVTIHRAAFLVDNLGYDPSKIVVTTFTRRAAEELRRRLSAFIGSRKTVLLNVGTIHSLCLRVLKSRGYDQTVAETYQVKRLVQDMMLRSKHYSPMIEAQTESVGWGFVYHWIQAAKLHRISADSSRAWFEQRILTAKTTDSPEIAFALAPWLADCYQALETGMREKELMDFADMLRWCANELDKPGVLASWRNKVHAVLNDELQDTNSLQARVLEMLAGDHLFSVGDLDQTLFAFTYASKDNIKDFLARHPNGLVYPLEVNYRSTVEVINRANTLISHNPVHTDERMHKIIRPRNGVEQGASVFVAGFQNDQEEAAYVADEIERLLDSGLEPGDIFVIYRTNAQSRPIEEELLLRRIPHTVSSGNGFWNRAVVQDVVGYLWMATKPNDFAFQRTFNKASAESETASRFLGSKFLDECKSRGGTLWEGMARLYDDPSCSRLWRAGIKDYLYTVNTIRSAPSLEEKLHVIGGHYSAYRHREEGTDPGEDDPMLETMESVFSAASRFHQPLEFLAYATKMGKMQRDQKGKSGNAVYCSTIHQSKGLEAKAVFGIGLADSLLPHWASGGSAPVTEGGYAPKRNPWLPAAYDGSVDDERMCAYVLVTRAMERLYLTWSQAQGKKIGLAPSRFLVEMGLLT